MIYLPTDDRVAGTVLLNPWARSTAGASRARLWHYYPRRLVDPAMWRKVFSGQFGFRRSIAGLSSTLAASLGFSPRSGGMEQTFASDQGFVDRMRSGLETFPGKTLIVLSDNDLTAQEFADLSKSDRRWSDLCTSDGVRRFDIPKADHTLSDAGSLDVLLAETIAWLHVDVETAVGP